MKHPNVNAAKWHYNTKLKYSLDSLFEYFNTQLCYLRFKMSCLIEWDIQRETKQKPLHKNTDHLRTPNLAGAMNNMKW